MPEIAFAREWWLLALPIATLPFWHQGGNKIPYPALAWFPTDSISQRLEWYRQLLLCAFLLTLVISLAAPYLKEHKVMHMGRGAHIVLTIDRSSSMNENFAGRYMGGIAKESKSAAARRLLLDFVSRRNQDLFSVVIFSTAPIHVLSLTQDHQAVKAAIRAIGLRGRGVTNIAPGLAMALEEFRGKAMTGARVILLVSDGGARIDPDTQEMLRQGFQDLGVRLYWIYLRNQRSVSVLHPLKRKLSETRTPEYFLHQFFQTLDVPYQVFEADNPKSLAEAIEAVGRLENRPLRYFEILPRQDLSQLGFTMTLILGLPLLFWYGLEVHRWLDSRPD